MREKKEAFNIIDYLSVATGQEYETLYKLKVKNASGLYEVIGTARDYSKIKHKDELLIGDKIYKVKEIDELGQRVLVEENFKDKNNEMLVCGILAVALCIPENNLELDVKNVNKLYDEIIESCYLDVLPTGFFLHNRFFNYKRKGMNFSKAFRNTTKIQRLRSKQELTI